MAPLSPGVYFESLTGLNGPTLVAPTSVYCLGTAGTGGTASTNEWVEVSSVSDFTTKFGADSPSVPYLNVFFAQFGPVPQPVHFLAIAKAGADPTLLEAQAALATMNETFPTGVIMAPELFDLQPSLAVGVATAMGATAIALNLVALIDPPRPARATVGTEVTADSVRKFAADITSNKTHMALYFPYLTVADGESTVDVPPSPAVAAVYVRAALRYGVAQPPAGSLFPLSGILGTSLSVNKAERDVLNPRNINAISYFRVPGSYLVYGARMLDTTELTFVNTRVILNTQQELLRAALSPLLFLPYDSKGTLFQRAEEAVQAVMYQFWNANALQGESPDSSYRVVCDGTNNADVDLAAGQLTVDVYQRIAGTVESIVVRPVRVTVSQLGTTTGDGATGGNGLTGGNQTTTEEV